MLKASKGKEIVLKTMNAIGVAAEISRTVAEKGVSILAVSAWVEGSSGVVHLITDDNLRSLEALQKKGYEPREVPVLMVEVPHKPGLLRNLTERLQSAGLDIKILYATALVDADACQVVLSTSDDDRALVAIHK